MSPDFAPFAALGVLGLVFAQFLRERHPPEVAALSGVALLLAFGISTPEQALSAIANPAPITIACMFILSGALVRAGVLEALSGRLARAAAHRPKTVVALFLGVVMVASAFMNNTPLVVMMMPLAIRLAAQMGSTASRLLIPLSYAAILGGTCTLIGASTNLLVDGVAREAGMRPFGLFEITGVGAAVAAVGLVYMAVFGRWLLPHRDAMIDHLTRRDKASFMTEIAIPEGSALIGRAPDEVEMFRRDGVRVVDLLRGDASLRRDIGEARLEAGDRVVLRTGVDELLTLREAPQVEMVDRLSEKKSVMVEALITPGCRMVGRSLGRLRLRRRYGVYPLAVHRRHQQVGSRLDDVVVRVGDTLLLEGDPEDIRRLSEDVDLVDLAAPSARSYRRNHAPFVIAVGGAVTALAAIGAAPLFSLALVAAVAVMLARSIDADEALAAIEGRVLVLIFAMLAIASALQSTGAVAMVVDALAPLLASAPRWALLASVILLASVMTELVTNNAVAVVLTPLAIGLGVELGVDPRPLAVGVMIGASASFATPIGYQTNTLVYAAGGYRFTDFVRFGLPMNLLTVATATLVIPLFWPL